MKLFWYAEYTYSIFPNDLNRNLEQLCVGYLMLAIFLNDYFILIFLII